MGNPTRVARDCYAIQIELAGARFAGRARRWKKWREQGRHPQHDRSHGDARAWFAAMLRYQFFFEGSRDGST
jgi:hypothetical protein